MLSPGRLCGILLALAASSCAGGAGDDASNRAGSGAEVADAGSGEGLYEVSGVAPRATGGFPSVVAFFREPGSDASVATPSSPEEEEPAVMDQYGNNFHPSVLVVSTGSRISFRNSEDVLHNVRVVDRASHETIFNVATPVVGSYEHRFDRPGIFDVSCQIHPYMAAFIFVTDADTAVVAESRGGFAVAGLRQGTYRVEVWNLDSARQGERQIVVDRDLELDLTEEGGEP